MGNLQQVGLVLLAYEFNHWRVFECDVEHLGGEVIYEEEIYVEYTGVFVVVDWADLLRSHCLSDNFDK